jgi:hypothetical protein
MAVTQVSWQAHLSRSGVQTTGELYAEEYFLIKCDGDTDSTTVQGAAAGGTTAPIYGAAHPAAAMYCNFTEYRPVQNETRRAFQCRAQYTDEVPVDPLTAPADIQWDFSEAGELPYFLDCTPSSVTGPNGENGPQPVVNSAGDKFQDYLTRATGDVVGTYTVNMVPTLAGLRAGQVIPYVKPVPAMNSDSFSFDGQSITQYQARIKGVRIGGIQVALVNGSKVYYRSVGTTLAFRDDWRLKIDDRGTRFLNANNVLQPIGGLSIVPNDTANTLGWPLDGDGNAKPNRTDDPAQLTFYPYPPMPFSGFGFA